MSSESSQHLLQRVTTGIPGLDVLLAGGLPAAGIYMLMGRPGAGKTILGSQIVFHHVAGGGRALYVTLLTESHARLFSSLQQLAFFDPARVGDAVTFLSAFQALEAEGLDGLLALLRTSLRAHRSTLLVLDGLVTVDSGADEQEVKKFLHKLQVLVELIGCTTLVLTGARDVDSNYAQQTMADGLLTLSARRVGMRSVRELEVLKLRGSAAVLGGHFFDITAAGVTVHPRLEAVLGARASAELPRVPLAFGVRKLDEMLGAGLLSGSTTMLLGAPGSGKTVLGLSFLSTGARQHEPGLYFGFSEAPDRVVATADRISLGLSRCVEEGDLEVRWRPALERTADSLAEELLAHVRRRKVRRLFIDGLGGFRESIVCPERMTAFFTALSNELRALGVTTLVSQETDDLYGSLVKLPAENLSATIENVILLRYVEVRSQLRRLVSIVKLREGGYDSSLREFVISDRGLEVSSTFKSAEAILSGHPSRRLEPSPKAPRKKATPKGRGRKT